MDAVYADFLKDFEADITAGILHVSRERSDIALRHLRPGTLDFIYIDGDHRYDAVRGDLELSLSACRIGALICLDDHCLGGWWGDGVVRAARAFLQDHAERCVVRFSEGNQLVLQVQ